MTNSRTSGPRTEGDVDARIVQPYLAALNIQPDQVRAQHTFSLRLGRNMINNVGGRDSRTGRLDYLIVNADGQPLFVIEEKGPGETLDDDDRDQGISYARLIHPMAPLVCVTNGSERRLYDTITKELLTDASEAALVRGRGRLDDDESLRVRAEAIEHFIGYSTANVAAFSRSQRAHRMETLRGSGGGNLLKYEPDLYLRRASVRDAMSKFLASPSTVFALVGPSGFGKTNEMCALAEDLGETHVTLFFNGGELAGPLQRVLGEEFGWYFSETLPLQQVCRRLSRIAHRSGRSVLIIMDAIDEVTGHEFPMELSDLASHLDQFDGGIRLIVSAKPAEWQRFTDFRGNLSPLGKRVFVPPRLAELVAGSHVVGALPDDIPLTASLEPFSHTECDEAIARYVATFRLTGEWKRDVKELARDPFMLRMIAEVASASGSIPQDSGERELVRRYIEQKVRRTSDPRFAHRELVAVAKALAVNARAAHSRHGAPTHGEGDPYTQFWAEGSQTWVAESDVRNAAGLPMTAAVADELVSYGVLLRHRDSDGATYLAFAYDRVRDYVLATHALQLPTLDRESFQETTTACWESEVGTSALLWYLPYTTGEQYAGFLDAASERVERLIRAYDAIRQHVLPEVRAKMDPRTDGSIGAAFCITRSGFASLGFFRYREGLPRVCADPAVGVFTRDSGTSTIIPAHLMPMRRSSSGFWYLRDPEAYAATYAKEQLEQIVKDGMLVESDDILVEERVVAMAIALARTLGLPRHPTRRVHRLADLILRRDLFPLDIIALRRAVQIELAFRSYQGKHMDAQLERKLLEHHTAAVEPSLISVSSDWTNEDLAAWRERAAREVDAGRDFTRSCQSERGLSSLAKDIDSLLRRRELIAEPLLPAPEIPDQDTLSGVHNFEEGYSDEELAHLLETLFDRALGSYETTLSNSFSERLRALLTSPTRPLGILCYRRPREPWSREQFSAVIESGLASSQDPHVLEGRRAVAVTVSESGVVNVDRGGAYGLEVEVSSPFGRFQVRVRGSIGIVSIISPSDAPPFAGNAPDAARRLAPVRGLVYRFARDAFRHLSPEQLRALTQQTPG